jgi:hypothetical protein
VKEKCTRVSAMIIVTVLVLTLGVIWQSTSRLSSSRAAPTDATVTLSGERIEQSSAAVADFDGDGDKEIVIGGADGKLYVIAYDGSSWSEVWSRQTADDLNAAGAPSGCGTTSVSDIRSAPAVGDLDGDGDLEIVVTTGGDPGRSGNPGTPHRNGGVLVYTYDSSKAWASAFSVVSGWPQPKLDIVGAGPGASDPDGCWDGIWSSPALADLDGDKDLEVIVEGFDRRLHVWHHDGTYVTGWPIGPGQIFRGGWSSPAVADIDKDEAPEIIFATDDNPGYAPPYYLYVFNGDGTSLDGFPVEASQNLKSSPAIGDIDGDGWLDIVVGTGTYESSGGNKVYAWDHSGSLLSGWPKTTGGKMPASPALGDLDGDDNLEVVIGCGAEGDPFPATCTSLYAWHGNGSSVSGFPMVPDNPIAWDGPNGLPYSPVLADYDGDGSIEILVLNRWSWGLSTVEANGSDGPAFMSSNTLSSPPVVDDVDNDGQLEVVVGGANSPGDKGMVYIWDVSGSASDSRPWPMFRHNVARTGRYSLPPQPPKLAFPNQVRVLHQSGSGNTETKYERLVNEGDGEFDWGITESIPRLQVSPSAGTVVTRTSVRLDINTTGLATGWHLLGTLAITGTAEGEAVDGSPAASAVYLYVGDVRRVYLPLATRSY